MLDKNRKPFSPRKLKLDLKKFDLKQLDAKGQELKQEFKDDLKRFEEKIDAKGREIRDDFKKFEQKLKSKARETLDKAKSVRSKNQKVEGERKSINLEDEAKFLLNWIESPLKTGSVIPSGKQLAEKMAAAVDLARPGLIVELGPGTGPVTQALLARGLEPERLCLVEYSEDFVALLRQRFPGVMVIQGDAYDLGKTLAPHFKGEIAAIVSSLPLLTRPDAERTRLLQTALAMMPAGAPFVQFTYMNPSPIPLDGTFESKVSRRIWKNIPPARIWMYWRAETVSHLPIKP